MRPARATASGLARYTTRVKCRISRRGERRFTGVCFLLLFLGTFHPDNVRSIQLVNCCLSWLPAALCLPLFRHAIWWPKQFRAPRTDDGAPSRRPASIVCRHKDVRSGTVCWSKASHRSGRGTQPGRARADAYTLSDTGLARVGRVTDRLGRRNVVAWRVHRWHEDGAFEGCRGHCAPREPLKRRDTSSI